MKRCCPNCLDDIDINKKLLGDILYYDHHSDYYPYICPVCGVLFCTDGLTVWEAQDDWDLSVNDNVFTQLAAMRMTAFVSGRARGKHAYRN